jgi:hypothetical protein
MHIWLKDERDAVAVVAQSEGKGGQFLSYIGDVGRIVVSLLLSVGTEGLNTGFARYRGAPNCMNAPIPRQG